MTQSKTTESTTTLYFEIQTLFWPKPEDTGILELQVIPNVCSEYSEHNFLQILA